MYISRHSSQKVGHTPPQLAGIDKIEMTFKPGVFKVSDSSKLDLTVRQKAGTTIPPLLLDGKGREVYASKLNHNSADGTTFDISHHGLLVAFNPSKIHTAHPFNLLTDPSDLGTVASHISGLASAAGIDFDPMAGRLYRVDLAKQAVMPDPPAQYGQALRYARGTRMNRKEYPDGHLFHNTNRELCFYDKHREQMARRKRGAMPVVVPQNLLRCEGRHMGTDTITKDLSITNLGELVNVDPITLAAVYTKNMERLLFNPLHAGKQIVISFEDDLAFIEDLASRYRTKAWDTYERLQGTMNLLELHGGFEGVERFIWALHDRGGITRSAAYRRITRLRKDLQERATLDTIRGQRSVATRLQEIRDTFTSIPNAA